VSIDDIPWIECSIEWYKFEESKVCRPGVEVMVKNKDNEEIKHILIGNINKNGGTCNCCELVNFNDVVLKFRKVLELEDYA